MATEVHRYDACSRMCCLFMWSVFLSGFFLCGNLAQAQSHEEKTESDEDPIPSIDIECRPACRGDFICREGKCTSPCFPPCHSGESCSKSGNCVPREVFKETQATVQMGQVSPAEEALLLELLAEEENKKEKKISSFAMLLNPLAMASLIPLYGIAVIPLNTQIGWRYAGIDIMLTSIVGNMTGFAGEIGPRFMPFGRGLAGLYLVARIGGSYPLGFMASAEIGYSWVIRHFAINLGIGGGWAGEVGFLPFGNFGIGFAV